MATAVSLEVVNTLTEVIIAPIRKRMKEACEEKRLTIDLKHTPRALKTNTAK